MTAPQVSRGDAEGSSALSLEEALGRVAQVATERRLGSERLSIRRLDGRILAQDVVATLLDPAETVMTAGQVLTPARVGLAAALGLGDLLVSLRPTVAVFTTGDELVEPGLPPAPGMVYNSNRELLMGLLRREGLEPVAWPTLPDDPQRLSAALEDAASVFDVVIICGRTSVGEESHVPATLRQRGELHFWSVKVNPGMPAVFGTIDRAVVLGLPDDPLAVLASFLVLARPLLEGLQGRLEAHPRRVARLVAPWSKQHTRLEFLPARLVHGEDAVLQVLPTSEEGPRPLRGVAESDALIFLTEGAREYGQGDMVEVIAC